MTKKFGFTLAEVLITLGIIGVVAAMTMPTLINQTNGAQYKAAYKKALSAISQGVTLNVALEDTSFADTVAGTAGSDAAASGGGATIASILKSRMNIVNTTSGNVYSGVTPGFNPNSQTGAAVPGDTNTVLFFNDGSMFTYKAQNAKECTKADGATFDTNCRGYIDVNGLKGPNKVVKCDGTTTGSSCTVKTPTDIYPVEFFDQTIVPATDAAKAVLYGRS